MATSNFDTVWAATNLRADATARAANFSLAGTAMDLKGGVTKITGANATISHGLTTLSQLIACPAGATGTLANRCKAVTVNGAVAYRWKATSAATTTLIASTATSSLRWIAIGTA